LLAVFFFYALAVLPTAAAAQRKSPKENGFPKQLNQVSNRRLQSPAGSSNLVVLEDSSGD
jgi:hypothetical protein